MARVTVRGTCGPLKLSALGCLVSLLETLLTMTNECVAGKIAVVSWPHPFGTQDLLFTLTSDIFCVLFTGTVKK